MYVTIVMFVHVLYPHRILCRSGRTDCKIVVSEMCNLDAFSCSILRLNVKQVYSAHQ